MGYIKEPKGVDFVVEPHMVTEEDRRVISEAIAHYKATGKFKKAPAPKRIRTNSKKKLRVDFQFSLSSPALRPFPVDLSLYSFQGHHIKVVVYKVIERKKSVY